LKLKKILKKFLSQGLNHGLQQEFQIYCAAIKMASSKKALGPCAIELYEGSQIMKLHNREACTPVAESWAMVQETFVNVT
jgi:hypothetical protein